MALPLQAGTRYSVPLTHATAADLLADLERLLVGGKGFAAATVNLDHLVKLRQSEAFRRAYSGHSHVVADGNPIVWLSRLSGQPVTLVPGSELIEPLADMAARTGIPVGFFGATANSLESSSVELERRYPGLSVATRIAPPNGFDPSGEEADARIAEMARSPARLWLLALGAPKQEIFAVRAWQKLPDRGFLSIGAGLDFISGEQVRAPALIRALALEWAWRMASNPRRLAPRYARCAAALPGLASAAWKQRRMEERC
ncbi:WecB/TagA/CpsF family glycosyltransferase [Aliiruegeria lutimaris]|uniref:WecB/TagA/CpsF family glycosyltransferase n=1 Tax=Aliiruegeria lutimaris TaxID=571298 RepID=UPI000B0B03E2